jgi:hypothetical protein
LWTHARIEFLLPVPPESARMSVSQITSQEINSYDLVIADRRHRDGGPRSHLLDRNVSSRDETVSFTGRGSGRQLDDDSLLADGDQSSERALHHVLSIERVSRRTKYRRRRATRAARVLASRPGEFPTQCVFGDLVSDNWVSMDQWPSRSP